MQQTWATWFLLQVLGFIPPDLPGDIQIDSQHLHFETQLMQNASHAAEGSKLRPGVMVFQGSLSPGNDIVVAKVPADKDLAEREVSIGMRSPG